MRPRRAMAAFMAGVSLVFMAAPARAEGSAQVFLDGIDQGNTTFLYLLYGYANGMNWMNTYLSQNGQPKVYCLPGSLAVTPEQNADILRQYIRRVPVDADTAAGLALLLAYRDTYPCPGQAPGV